MHIKGSFICSEGIKVKLDGDEEKIGLLKSLVKVIFFRESKLGQKCDICSILLIFRPISVSFLIRTSGKEYHSQAGSTTTYLIIVTDATDAVSVNFSGRCKFLQI